MVDEASADERTRRDHATQKAEDFVEAIADAIKSKGSSRVIDLSERFDA